MMKDKQVFQHMWVLYILKGKASTDRTELDFSWPYLKCILDKVHDLITGFYDLCEYSCNEEKLENVERC